MRDIIEDLQETDKPHAIAIIVGQEGAAYRPLGATMAIFSDGRRLGHLSSGCVEEDIIHQALSHDSQRVLRYGVGSPFLDMKLPCGGGMDVLILPNPDIAALLAAKQKLAARKQVSLTLDMETSTLNVSSAPVTERAGHDFHWALIPTLKFCVFGNGHEANSFAELAAGAGYPVSLFTTNEAIIEKSRLSAERRHLMNTPRIPTDVTVDPWTSITLFFHDHDLEQRILTDALQTPAFYIGAQGSFATHQ
ncbi:MAG: XdhC family protein, partial [Planktomarina sp.]